MAPSSWVKGGGLWGSVATDHFCIGRNFIKGVIEESEEDIAVLFLLIILNEVLMPRAFTIK
jgi:hypothetical protein